MAIKHKTIFTTDTLHMTEGDHGDKGFWLWDKAWGGNLSMRADSERSAFIEVVEYYQNRLTEIESENKEMKKDIEFIAERLKKYNDEY